MERITDLTSLNASPCIIYKCIYGSQAFGLATHNSDLDIRGVFVLPQRQYFGLERIEQISDERSNQVYWELDRFVSLLLKNNPNALETLAVDSQFILLKSPIFYELSIDIFLSGLCFETFVQYAGTQLKKARGLNKKISQPIEVQRKTVLDFCYVIEGCGSKPFRLWLGENGVDAKQCGLVSVPHVNDSYALFVGVDGEFNGVVKSEESDDVTTSSIPRGRAPSVILNFNKDAYRHSCRSYQEYWTWVKNRNQDRYQTTIEAGQGFDTKNMMHVFRLIGMAEDIVRKKAIVTLRPEREALLRIKRGERTYEDLLKEADDRLRLLQEEFKKSDLPPLPNRERALDVLFRIRDQFYR